jgi:hypothetical protein
LWGDAAQREPNEDLKAELEAASYAEPPQKNRVEWSCSAGSIKKSLDTKNERVKLRTQTIIRLAIFVERF